MSNLLNKFTLQKVIGGTSPHVLQDYFHNRGLFQEITDFDALKTAEKSASYKTLIADKILTIDRNFAETVNDFRKVFVLSRQSALLSLIDRIGCHEEYTYLLSDIQELAIKKDYDKVFYFLEKEPEFIGETYLIYSLNAHTESYWNRRQTGIPKRTEDISKSEVKLLEQEIKGILQKTSRGHHCTIQHILFDDKDHLFVIAEDMPVTLSLWEQGNPEDVLINPCFDLAIVYDRHEGELDICCIIGGTSFRNMIQIAFAKAVLATEVQELKEEDEIYDLSYVFQQLIENKKVDFCTNVAPNIVEMFIRSIKLKASHWNANEITLSIVSKKRSNTEHDEIYNVIEQYMKTDATSPNTVDVTEMRLIWIECRVIYQDPLTHKTCQKKFNISGRSGCNLGFNDIDKEIRECLKVARIQLKRTENA